MEFKSIAVFCGSQTGNNPLYKEHATKLGYLPAEKNITLIYGAGNRGIKNNVANAVIEKKGQVTGIITEDCRTGNKNMIGLSELIGLS